MRQNKASGVVRPGHGRPDKIAAEAEAWASSYKDCAVAQSDLDALAAE